MLVIFLVVVFLVVTSGAVACGLGPLGRLSRLFGERRDIAAEDFPGLVHQRAKPLLRFAEPAFDRPQRLVERDDRVGLPAACDDSVAGTGKFGRIDRRQGRFE